MTPEERFWQQVDKTDGCWNWTGWLNFGYGRLRVGKVKVGAHRFAYELLVGPIPEGLQIDHLCRNRACVNPDHLEAVTGRENTLRGLTITAANAAKTHCNSGHEFAGDNLRITREGERECRACRRIAWQAYRARRRGAA